MLTRAELVQFGRALQGTKVLSIYITAWSDDPARRNAWRIELNNALDEQRDDLRSASHIERETFAACVKRVQEYLDQETRLPGEPGWVAFVTKDGIQHAEAVPFEVATRVEWGDGIRLAPYVRALKQSIPAVLALADGHEARVYRYADGRIALVDKLWSHKHSDEPGHMGAAPRLGFHPGTRGPTGTDIASRARVEGRNLLVDELVHRLLAESGPAGWMLISGIPEMVDAVYRAMPERERARLHRLSSLDVHASEGRIGEVAEEGVMEASRERDAGFVTEMIALVSGAYARGRTGWKDTEAALEARAVDRLCFTDAFLRALPDQIELAVALALEQDAEIEHVSGAGAERLDEEAGGIGARLRFRPVEVELTGDVLAVTQ